jgi:1,4-alpha-glucan branching enzyme
MPVMEFEGNESWGTSFHMALDKFYGTSDKLKSLLMCHQNGCRYFFDVALNHAFGRNQC